jgi:hypothetical protein
LNFVSGPYTEISGFGILGQVGTVTALAWYTELISICRTLTVPETVFPVSLYKYVISGCPIPDIRKRGKVQFLIKNSLN